MSDVSTESFVLTSKAHKILDSFALHLEQDHDMVMQRRNDGHYFIEHAAFRVDFKLCENGIGFTAKAPNQNALIFFKEEIAEHVSEIDPKAADNIRWSGEASKVGGLPPNFHILTVVKSDSIHADLQRTTLSFPNFSAISGEGIHMRLMLPLESGQQPQWPKMAANGAPIWPTGSQSLHARFVTISDVDILENKVSFDIVRHSEGLISRWAQTAKKGDQVGAMGPAGVSALPKVANYLLGADLTALPTLLRLLQTVPDNASGHVLLSVDDDFPLESYLTKSPLKVHTIRTASSKDDVIEKLKQLASSTAPDFAWYGGEFETAQLVRGLFKKNLKLEKGAQLSVAYWRAGHPGYGS